MQTSFRTHVTRRVLAEVEPSSVRTLEKVARLHQGEDAELAHDLIDQVPPSQVSHQEQGKAALAILDEYNHQPEVPLVMQVALEAANTNRMWTSWREIGMLACKNVAATTPIGLATFGLQMIDAVGPYLMDQNACGVAALKGVERTDLHASSREVVSGALDRIHAIHPFENEQRTQIAVDALNEVLKFEGQRSEVEQLAQQKTNAAVGFTPTAVIVGGVPIRRRRA